MKALRLRQRVTRSRVKVGKLPEFERLQRPLWIGRVLVRAQEGQLAGANPEPKVKPEVDSVRAELARISAETKQ